MNIVILHCHFEQGGVTQVVQNHVRALRDCDLAERIVLVSGGRIGGLSTETIGSVTSISIDGFDYDTAGGTSDRGLLLARLENEFTRHGLGKDNTVLHWHNHGLGKNTTAPAVVRDLAESGWRLLLQIHDFAEDNRPLNYQQLIAISNARSKSDIDRYLYPVAAQIHYATLTRADQLVVRQLGIPTHQAHWLPNSVAAPTAISPSKQESLKKVRSAMGLPRDARWSLYPVRGIRRKNIGEYLLLSRWTRPNHFSGLTLRPATVVEERSYDRWLELAGTVAPRAVFDAAHHDGISFADNLAASDSVWSTSVAEGFGMTFLEPWLAGREVIARRLSSVTDDFQAAGVMIEKLYDQIPIPGDTQWIGQCRAEYQTALEDAWQEVPTEFRPVISQELIGPNNIDFAILTPRRQSEVLQRLNQDSVFETETQQLSSSLIRYLNGGADDVAIEHNASTVRDHFSIERIGQRLLQIYQSLLESPIDRQTNPPLNSGVAVETINQVRPFYPCRTEVL